MEIYFSISSSSSPHRHNTMFMPLCSKRPMALDLPTRHDGHRFPAGWFKSKARTAGSAPQVRIWLGIIDFEHQQIDPSMTDSHEKQLAAQPRLTMKLRKNFVAQSRRVASFSGRPCYSHRNYSLLSRQTAAVVSASHSTAE